MVTITSFPKQINAAREIVLRLKAHYPTACCTLRHHSPLQLLVATILSAQCTDRRVNQITPALFARFPDAHSFVAAPLKEIEDAIRSTGFFHQKAKNIQNACALIIQNHQGQVPDSMTELLKLPGVGRKTANVILGTAFGKNEGIVVDTHVQRLSRRLKLTSSDQPNSIELDLLQLIPRADWTVFSHLLIEHGRQICKAKSPRCEICFLRDLCPAADTFVKPIF